MQFNENITHGVKTFGTNNKKNNLKKTRDIDTRWCKKWEHPAKIFPLKRLLIIDITVFHLETIL